MEAARVNAKLTQLEAAERLEVSRQTILNWEKGISSIDLPHFRQMCSVYGVPEECIILPKKST